MAGADSFFSSDSKVMLTKAVPSPAYDEDKALLRTLGLTMRPPFKDGPILAGEFSGKYAATADAAVLV